MSVIDVVGQTIKAVVSITMWPVITLIAICLLSWIFITRKSQPDAAIASSAQGDLRRPPTMPSFIPYIGHTLCFMWNAPKLMTDASRYLGRETPVRIILGNMSNYIISGPEAVTSFFRDSKELSYSKRNVALMSNLFGCPKHLLHQFESGAATMPGGEDIDQLIHVSINAGLAGEDLDIITKRFQEHYERSLRNSARELFNDWTRMPDFVSFVEARVFEAAVYAFFGPHMLDCNPNLASQYAEYNRNIRSLLLGLPRWMNPRAHRAREHMVDSMVRWQQFSLSHKRPESISREVKWEPLYGSRVVRERLLLLTRRGIVDERARAAEMLAIMWAFNANSVTASVWLLLESLQDTDRVVERIHATRLPLESKSASSNRQDFDMSALMADPLLQSMYAEVLRVRFAAIVLRQPTTDTYSFRGWHIKKDELITLSTYTQAIDPQIWNAGYGQNKHPLHEYWADRFLVDPRDALSGPLKNPRRRQPKNVGVDKPYFSMDGLSGAWIPYGGGRNHCPGRYFAKIEMMLSLALFHTYFEMELETMPEMDMRLFGFGSMPIKGKVACRIRSRKEVKEM